VESDAATGAPVALEARRGRATPPWEGKSILLTPGFHASGL
jgi:hypothetical protein